MREVRLRFSKEDRAKYIGHLDVNRVIARALKRAEIPLWYTQGYNPHAHMSFSLPLSLGVESVCECVDIRLIDEIENEEIKKKMNEVLPSGIRIIDVYDDFRNCNEIAFSDYTYLIQTEDNDFAMMKLKDVLDGCEILALKKGKVGRRRVFKEQNIKPFIDNYNISVRDNMVVINFRLAAGPQKNLNPTLLFDTLIRVTQLQYDWRSISRIKLLDKEYSSFF